MNIGSLLHLLKSTLKSTLAEDEDIRFGGVGHFAYLGDASVARCSRPKETQ